MAVPVLLITFNRPDHTRKVLEAIRQAKPEELFVSQDGAREGNQGDVDKCAKVQEVVKELVDWPCNLHTNYMQDNLGCGPGPAAGITWFFENVPEGIIIEDDAVPHQDFFVFASQMLEKYRDNEDVMAVGSMHLDSRTYGDGSYYFSRMNRTLCAWATWKRAWDCFDIYLKNVARKDLNNALKWYGCKLREREYWCAILDMLQKTFQGGTSWDQQFWINIWLLHRKGIMPNVNLSTNIGFDETATHLSSSQSPGANIATSPILPISDPSDCNIRKDADLNFQKIYFTPWAYGREGLRRLPFRINRRIKRLFGVKGSWFKR